MTNETLHKFRLTRRTFLLGALVALASTVSFYFLRSPKPLTAPALRHLKTRAAYVFAAVYGAITGYDEPESKARALEFLDNLLPTFERKTQRDLLLALFLLEHGTWVKGFWGRFSRLSPEDQAVYLKMWEGGTVTEHFIFDGIRSLCFLVCYADEKQWDAIGYTGPLVQRRSQSHLPPFHALHDPANNVSMALQESLSADFPAAVSRNQHPPSSI